MRTNGKPAVQGEFDEGDGDVTDALTRVGAGGFAIQTRTQFSTAVQLNGPPRDLEAVKKRCLAEARMLGEDAYYSWTVKDKNSPTGVSLIEGPSIDAAMVLARNWGNCGVPIEVAIDAPKHWILAATFVDLETGFNLTRLFRQRKNQKTGKMDDDRALDIAFQIGQSKAHRNVIVKAMPSWLMREFFETAQGVEEAKYKDVGKHTPRAIGAWAKPPYNVTQEMLEKKVGRKAEAWIPRDLALLAAIFRAVKEGVTTVANEFSDEPPPASEPAEKPSEQTEEPAAQQKRDSYGEVEDTQPSAQADAPAGK